MLEQAKNELIQEIMLQINENLYIKGEISRELYEQAKIKIVDVSLTQKKIILRNIDAQVGTNCSISIFAGTSEDEASNKDTGVELSESFSIILHPDKPQNAPEDWVPNPNTGR